MEHTEPRSHEARFRGRRTEEGTSEFSQMKRQGERKKNDRYGHRKELEHKASGMMNGNMVDMTLISSFSRTESWSMFGTGS